MINKFGAAGAEGRSDARHEVVSIAAEIALHPFDNLSKDISDVPSPAAMDVGYDVHTGVKYDDSLAVGLLYQDGKSGDVCYDSVCCRSCHLAGGAPRPNHKNAVPMSLFHIHEVFGADGILDNVEIGSYMLGKISHVVTGVEAVIGGVARAAMPGKHSMCKLIIT